MQPRRRLIANMGRTFEPTPEQRRQVLAMTGYGIHQTEIATLLEIDAKTLRKHFRRELDIGMTEANARVAQALYKNAVTNENVTAQIWWTKARMGWKEATDLNVGGKLNVEIGIDRPPVIEESREEWLARRRAELIALEPAARAADTRNRGAVDR